MNINKVSTRADLFNLFDKKLIIAELGVFKGDFSKEIYKICEPKKLFLVDLFDGYFGSGDKDGNNYHKVQLENEYDKLKTYFYDFTNVEVIKNSTINFLNTVEKDFFDIIYIDADHSYNSVKNDLLLSMDKIKAGGWICGHDYVIGTEAKLAVDDFCYESGLSIDLITNDGCPSFRILNNK